MESINTNILFIILELLEEMGSYTDLSDFCNNLLLSLKILIPYENGHFIFFDPESNFLPISYRYNIDDKTHNDYLKYYRFKDDFMLNYLNTPEPKRSTDIMDYSQWRKTEYFNDFQLKNNYYYIAIADIHYKDQLISSLSLVRSRKRYDFTNEELIILKTLTPYLANDIYKLILLKKYRETEKGNLIQTIEKSGTKYNLTDREIDIANYLIRGKSNEEIADILYISKDTVKKHVNSVFRKVKVRNRTEILAKFLSLL